jgi:glycosyltransferase involved in cell wall biosynthesis
MSEIIRKEYYKLDKTKPTVGLLMMVKNEHKRLQVSLDSVVGHVDALIFYDTGSTDNTIEIIEKFSEKHKINLYLKRGDFVDFSTSRNVSLDFADTVDVMYILLMDCNDELKGGEKLKPILKHFADKDNNSFLVCQEWWCGQLDKYYNTRLVKTRCGWRYRGSVHEWMKDTLSDTDQPRFPVIRLEEIVLYQDRTQDDDKSGKRFTRDRELLLKDHKADPKEPRTLFYLAQTCQCLNLHDEALYYSKLRLEQKGFDEERFHSYIRCGVSCLALGHEWADGMKWFIRAYEEFQRAEPLVKIADFYRHLAGIALKDGKNANNLWRISYMYAKEACDLAYPEHCILFVDKGIYDYYRWHVMGIVGYYAGKYEEGKEACLKAISQNINKEVNEKNLQFYLDYEKKIAKAPENKQPVITKEQFLINTVDNLRKDFPNATQKQILKRANAMWKKRVK